MSKNAMLFIHALTSLHPGSGTALGVVDLPVQRERHTNWPTIPGSSLKGVLREARRPKNGNSDDREKWLAVFGPETAEADAHAGALSLTDARILAFPVRSLKGVFAWVTCPAVLERLNRDLCLTGLNGFGGTLCLKKGEAACVEDSPLLVEEKSEKKLVLEEFDFTRSSDAGDVAEWLAKRATRDEGTQNRLKTHLVVLYDDDFTHFVRHATEVVARVGLDYERKTVKSGALFYQEFLPAETIFYSVILAEKSRRKDSSMSETAVLDYVSKNLPRVLQIGGDETIGKGLCAVKMMDGESDKSQETQP